MPFTLADLMKVSGDSIAAGAQGENQYVKGAQETQQAKLKSFLQNQAQEAAVKQVEAKMPKDANGNPIVPEGSGFGVTPEGASYTKGFNYMEQQNKEKSGDAQARSKANAAYMQGVAPIQKSLMAAQEGLDAVNDPTNKSSKGQALGSLTRMLDLTRFPNKEEAAQMLPPTLQGEASGFMNWAGDSQNPMNEADRQAFNSFAQHIIESKQNQHNLLKQNAQQIYQSSPYANPTGMQALSGLGAPMDSQFDSLTKKYGQIPQTQGANLTAAPNPGPVDRLRAYVKGFAPGAPNPQPNQAPVAPQAQQQSNSGLGFTADDIAAALAKKGQQAVANPNKPLTPPQQPQQGQ